MNEEVNAALRAPEVAEKLSAQGIAVSTSTPAAATTFIDGQSDVWSRVVKANDIKAD